jgi:hypothetical protein
LQKRQKPKLKAKLKQKQKAKNLISRDLVGGCSRTPLLFGLMMPDESDKNDKKLVTQTVEIPVSPLMIGFFANNYIGLRGHINSFIEKTYPGWKYKEINVKVLAHTKILWKNGQPFYRMVIFKK